ncbi:MAG: glycerophosphodiester phosphodiesterase family protein [Gammaproteobacteria bacterium]
MQPPPPRPVVPEIVAHRGDAEHFPENTLPALEAALRLGLRHVEFDVQLSADSVPYVIHDASLERTTRGVGDIRLMRSGQLDGLDAGEPARFGSRHAGTRLPRLAAVPEMLRRFPGALAFVEVKRASLAHHGHSHCIARILAALAGVEDRCIVISFDAEACRVARAAGGMPVGWVLDGTPQARLAVLEDLRPEYAFCDLQLLPGDAPPPQGPWTWAVYEVTDAAMALSLSARGIALVESMAPARLLGELAAAAVPA